MEKVDFKKKNCGTKGRGHCSRDGYLIIGANVYKISLRLESTACRQLSICYQFPASYVCALIVFLNLYFIGTTTCCCLLKCFIHFLLYNYNILPSWSMDLEFQDVRAEVKGIMVSSIFHCKCIVVTWNCHTISYCHIVNRIMKIIWTVEDTIHLCLAKSDQLNKIKIIMLYKI